MASAQPAARHERACLFLSGLRKGHTFILNRSWILDRTQHLSFGGPGRCLFLSTFARNANTSSRRSFTARTRPLVRSVRARSWSQNSRCSRSRRRAGPPRPCPQAQCPRGRADPAAARMGRALALGRTRKPFSVVGSQSSVQCPRWLTIVLPPNLFHTIFPLVDFLLFIVHR